MISLLEWQDRISWKFHPFFFDCTSQMNNLILVKISPKWPLSITIALYQLQRNAHEINLEARRHLAGWANNGKNPARIAVIIRNDACVNLPALEADQRLSVTSWGPANPLSLGRQNQMKHFSRIQKQDKKILTRCWKGDAGQRASKEFDLAGTFSLVIP